MSNERAFRGVWIPADLWLNRSLSIQEKVMLIEIDSLSKDRDRGCYKKNQGFSEFFGLSKNRVSEIIKSLESKGFIRIRYKRKGQEIMERNIFIIAPFDKPGTPSEKRDNPPGKAGQPPSENREERGSSLRGSVEGNSFAPSSDGACKVCGGEGLVWNHQELASNKIKCPKCQGTGKEPQPPAKQEKPKRKTKAEKLFDKVRTSGYLIAQASDDVLTEWCKLRAKKGASDSDLVHKRIDGQLQILINHGMTIDAALTEQVARNWTDLKAEWFDVVKRGHQNQAGHPHNPESDFRDSMDNTY